MTVRPDPGLLETQDAHDVRRRSHSHRQDLARRRLGLLSVALAALAAGCGTAARSAPPATGPASQSGGRGTPPAAAAGLTRKSEGGQVTIEVTWAGPPPAGAGPSFKVAMDTHAVDLDGYDLGRLAALRVDGRGELAPSEWRAPKGGHHREGTLAFPARSGDGTALPPGARTLELVIRDVAGVPERSFTWQL